MSIAYQTRYEKFLFLTGLSLPSPQSISNNENISQFSCVPPAAAASCTSPGDDEDILTFFARSFYLTFCLLLFLWCMDEQQHVESVSERDTLSNSNRTT
jgi:hypothetical protein